MKKDHFIWAFIIACTAFNTIVVASYFAGLGKFNPAMTGPFGDTIGGILSPIVGAVSIFYIIRAYNAQIESKQLEHANSNYQLLQSFLEETILRIENKEFSYTPFINVNGNISFVSALNGFVNNTYNDVQSRDGLIHFYNNSENILKELLHILENLYTIKEKTQTYNLTTEQKDLLAYKIDRVLQKNFESLWSGLQYREKVGEYKIEAEEDEVRFNVFKISEDKIFNYLRDLMS